MEKPIFKPADVHNKENQPGKLPAVKKKLLAKAKADKKNNDTVFKTSIPGLADFKFVSALDQNENVKNALYKQNITMVKAPENVNKKPPKPRKKAAAKKSLSESDDETKDEELLQFDDSSSDDSLSEPEVEKSDHELDPESDFDEDTSAAPNASIRTAEEGDNIACSVCKKAENPEWILICDECDDGYHCSCLKPVLYSIPSSDTWSCPPCSHEKLIQALEGKLEEYDRMVKKLDRSQMLALRRKRFAMMSTARATEQQVSSRLRQKPVRSYVFRSYEEKFKGIEGLEDSVVVESDKDEDWKGSQKSSQESQKVSTKAPVRTGKRRLLNINDSSDEDEQPAPAPEASEGRSLRSRSKH